MSCVVRLPTLNTEQKKLLITLAMSSRKVLKTPHASIRVTTQIASDFTHINVSIKKLVRFGVVRLSPVLHDQKSFKLVNVMTLFLL